MLSEERGSWVYSDRGAVTLEEHRPVFRPQVTGFFSVPLRSGYLFQMASSIVSQVELA